MSKIVGATVGTPTSPKAMEKELKPVKSVNGMQPDKNGDLALKASDFENDAGYLTEHQDISGKLDAAELPQAINTALEQAKSSGEFDGRDGVDGYSPIRGVDYWTEADQAGIKDGLKAYSDQMLGDISAALDELHAYAVSLTEVTAQ